MTLARVLSAEAERQSLSLNALADRAGMSPSRTHAILTGKTLNPGILTVQAILTALGKSLAWLGRELARPDSDGSATSA